MKKLILVVFIALLTVSCNRKDAIMVVTYEIVYPDKAIEYTQHIKCNSESRPRVQSHEGTNTLIVEGPTFVDGYLEQNTAPIRIKKFEIYKDEKR